VPVIPEFPAQVAEERHAQPLAILVSTTVVVVSTACSCGLQQPVYTAATVVGRFAGLPQMMGIRMA
jgi:hypothetical protein